MNIEEIETWADRRSEGTYDSYELILELCKVIQEQEKRIVALEAKKPSRSHVGWGSENKPISDFNAGVAGL